jgi:RsiW-degrading membrane proteinase PrsW (M82 family)
MSQWRSRAFQLTRDRTFLLRVTAGILAVCTLISVCLIVLSGKGWPPSKMKTPTKEQRIQSREAIQKEEYEFLMVSTTKEPAKVVQWLISLNIPRGEAFDPVTLNIGQMDLAALFRKHAGDPGFTETCSAYARFKFAADVPASTRALEQLSQISRRDDPPRHANELYAGILYHLDRLPETLDALMREVRRYPEAVNSRRDAFDVALTLKDTRALAELCKDKDLRESANPFKLRDAAKFIGDRQLLLEAMARMTWERWMQGASLFLALVAAGIWYVILVYTGSREQYRWLRFLPAVFGGIVSVTVLLWLQETMEYRMPTQGESEAPTPTHAMMDWVLNVGLPEEGVKAFLFAFFLPVLLHNGSPTKAALVGGCVGLGFALDENLLYFSNKGASIALGRFLTANVIHIALTGILGWSLYELFRSRFHKATEFLIAFGGVTLAHGLYNYTADLGNNDVWGMSIMHVIILAAVAKFYLKLLHSTDERPAGWVFSRTSIFVWGIAVLVGVMMVAATYQSRSIQGITDTLTTALSLAVIAFIFVREFREV